jgi:glycosyltransferase involved in cell wall biosynthesis
VRIALVHPFCWPEVRRGAERYLADLAWYLAGAGHAVTVLTGTAGPSSTETVEGIRYVRRRHLTHPRLEARRVEAVETFGAKAFGPLLRERHDVVHAMTPTAALAGIFSRTPTVFTLLGLPRQHHFGNRPGDWRLFATAVRRAAAVTALTDTAAEAGFALTGRRMDVLAPGVRLEEFPVRDAAAQAGEPLRILFASDAGDWRKHADDLLAAFAIVRSARPDARLVLGGPGDWRWAVPPDFDEGALGAVDDIGPGELGDLPARYRSATVTVLPAEDEAFGLVLVESMASGTPVVCSDSGGMKELVTPATGRVFPLGDRDELAAALLAATELATDPESPARCRANAGRWDWSTAVGPAHERLYERVAGGEVGGSGPS